MKCNVQAKALIQLLLKDSAPDTHTHTQIPRMRNGPSRLVRFGRDERTRPASRCDQPSTSEMRPAQRQRDASSIERCVQRSSGPNAIILVLLTLVPTITLSACPIAPQPYSPLSEGGRLLAIRSPSLDGFGTQFARRPREWPKGAPSPLIGLGGGGHDGRRGGPPLKQGE